MSNAKPLDWPTRVARWADLQRHATPRQRRIFERARRRQEALLMNDVRPPESKATGERVWQPVHEAQAVRRDLAFSALAAGGSSFVRQVAVRCDGNCKQHDRPRLHSISRTELAELFGQARAEMFGEVPR